MLTNLQTFQKQAGMSIVEIMVGSLVGLIILSGVLTLYVSTVKSSADTLKAAKLNQELNAAMGIMSKDIRRAGFWNAAAIGVVNPYTATAKNIDIRTSVNTDASTNVRGCIVYTYDRDADGTVPSVSSTHYYGFKLMDNTLYMRNGTTAFSADCSTPSTSWLPITDPSIIKITSLDFDTVGSKCLNSSSSPSSPESWFIASASANFPCADSTGKDTSTPANNYDFTAGNPDRPVTGDTLVETRHVTVTMDAELQNDSLVTKKVEHSTRVRNDRVTTF